MLEENLKDAGEIISNILNQPLSIPGASKKELSLLEAAGRFDPNEATTSDLRAALLSFLQFPAPTETMLREMEILENELYIQN